MTDRISILHDDVLCRILSFLPTKVAVSTCLLSKRWQTLWCSVPAFDFHYFRDSDCRPHRGIDHNFDFADWMNAFLWSRDPLQSFRRFSFESRFYISCLGRFHHSINIYKLIPTVVLQQKLEHLHLSLYRTANLPVVILRCETLVVLSLSNLELMHFHPVDLPSLKVMSLYNVFIADHEFLADFLSGCPNLEDMKICGNYTCIETDPTEPLARYKFKKLHKLVRAVINKDLFPLEVVSNVHFLRIEQMDKRVELIANLIPQFHNLSSIEFHYKFYDSNRLEVFNVLNHCPKLQHLVIETSEFYDCSWVWQHPSHVPNCFSSHLKTCRVTNYAGHRPELEFVRYIMQNARGLQNMKVFTRRKRCKLEKRLFSCTRLSSTCKLSFSRGYQ